MTKQQLLNQNKIDKATIANYERKIAEFAFALNDRNERLEIIYKYEINMKVFKTCSTKEEYNFKTNSRYNISEKQFKKLKEWQK